MTTEKTFPLGVVQDNVLVLSNSIIENYIECPRKFQYYALLRREFAGTKSALKYGEAVHRAMETRYRHDLRGEQVLVQIDKDLENAQFQAIEEVYKNVIIPEDDFRTLDRCKETIQLYNKHYAADYHDVLDVEMPFCLPLGEVATHDKLTPTTIYYAGCRDERFTENGETWLRDYKTTSMFGDSYVSEFYNSSQFMGYCWAEEVETGKRPMGMCVDIIVSRKKTIKGSGIPTEFHRHKIYYAPERIVEWAENTMMIARDMVRALEENEFPMHTKSCVGKFGKCPYFDVCVNTKDLREQVLYSDLYKDVEGGPTQKKINEAMRKVIG